MKQIPIFNKQIYKFQIILMINYHKIFKKMKHHNLFKLQINFK